LKFRVQLIIPLRTVACIYDLAASGESAVEKVTVSRMKYSPKMQWKEKSLRKPTM